MPTTIIASVIGILVIAIIVGEIKNARQVNVPALAVAVDVL